MIHSPVTSSTNLSKLTDIITHKPDGTAYRLDSGPIKLERTCTGHNLVSVPVTTEGAILTDNGWAYALVLNGKRKVVHGFESEESAWSAFWFDYEMSDIHRPIKRGYLTAFNSYIAWFREYGQVPDQGLEHKNGDRSDDRLENLRPTSDPITCKRVGKYFGVSKERELYRARIRDADGKRINIGRFNSELDAARWYNRVADELGVADRVRLNEIAD